MGVKYHVEDIASRFHSGGLIACRERKKDCDPLPFRG